MAALGLVSKINLLTTMLNLKLTKFLAVSFSLLALCGYFAISSVPETPSSVFTNTVSETAQAEIRGVKTLAAEDISELVQQASVEQQAFAKFIATPPASLQDVPAPQLRLDSKAIINLDNQLRGLFEHYLAGLGEEPLESVVARIKHDLQAQLSGQALEHSLALLESYLQYRNHLGVIKNDFANSQQDAAFSLAAVREMQQNVRRARLQFFSDQQIASLFSADDDYDDYVLARMEIAANTELGKDEKMHQLAQLDARAPDWIIESNQTANAVTESRQRESALRKTGASDEQVYQQRVANYGVDGAEKLKVLDAQQAQWRARVDSYRIELLSIISSSGVGVDRQLLSDLRSVYFQGPELTRIAALDWLELGVPRA